MAFIGILLAVAFYFLPSIIGGKKRNANSIFALNLLLGWSVIGWVVALVWALANDAEAPAPAAPRPQASAASELERLYALHQAGVLTAAEYAAAKQRALGA